MLRPQKHVATSFLLSATAPWSQLLFSCCDLNCLSVHYLVATWDLGRDLIVSFLAKIYVATLKACRDINFAYPIATSLLSHNNFNFTAHFYCYDMNSRSRPRLVFLAYIFVATSILVCYQLCRVATSKRCRDMKGGFSYLCSCPSFINVCCDMNSSSRP